MSGKTFKFGKRYKIANPDPEDAPYDYVEPVKYGDGMTISDCWIMDENGNVHPGYNVSPVPFNRDAVQEV